jgi:CheY-like chemotaxis protein
MKRSIQTFKMGKLVRLPASRDALPIEVTYTSADEFLADHDTNLRHATSRITTSRVVEPDRLVELRLSVPQLVTAISLDAVVRNCGDGAMSVAILASSHDRLRSIVAQVKVRDPRLMLRAIRVLIVDDNSYVCHLVQRGLTSSARHEMRDYVFSFDTAENGVEGLELLMARTFDIAIVDIYLPVLDGAALVERARNTLGLNLPIIGMSAGGPPARSAAIAAGVSDFLDKPIRLQQVSAAMRQLLEVRAA